MKKSVFFYLIIFLLICLPAFGKTESIIIDSEKKIFELDSYLQILEDKDKNLTIEDILSQDISSKFIKITGTPNFGFTNSTYWAKFTIENKLYKTDDFILELTFPKISYIDLYIHKPDNKFIVKKTGDSRPFYL